MTLNVLQSAWKWCVILDINSIDDECIDAKDMADKHMVYQNEPLDTKWVNTFGEQETHSHKSRLLLLLVLKILTTSGSSTFV